jgi:hypothetical protein
MLKEKVMIVHLNISQWAARKYDAEASQEVNTSHNADSEASRVNKVLMISKEFDAIKKNASAARRYHNQITLPWDDGGQRILPVTAYFEYMKEIECYITKNKELVADFVAVFDVKRKEMKNKLGSLYNKADYPSQSEIADKFGMRYKFTPIADGDDLRVSLSKDEVKAIKKNVEASYQEKINTAKGDVLLRIEKVVQKVYDTLSDKDAKFHDTLIGNVEALIELLPTVNFDGDEKIEEYGKALKKLCVDPKKLRADVTKRSKIKKKAKKILKQIKNK